MSDYEEILKEIKKSINGDSAYKEILKSIELEVQKCGVSLKKVREAVTPLIKQLMPKESLESQFGEEWTDEDYEEDVRWITDRIAYCYREWYNSKELKMYGFNADGSRNIPTVNGETGDYDLEFVSGRGWEDSPFADHKEWASMVMPQLFIRTSFNSKGQEGMVMPTRRDLEYQAKVTYPFMVKLNKKGLTLTHINGEVDTNSINFQAPLMNRADKMFSESWRDKANNGISDIVADRKAKKITNEQAQAKIRDALINQANGWADKESKNLTKDYANVGIPIETYYVPIG